MWLLLLNVFDEGREEGKSRRAGGICTFAEAKLTGASHRAGSMNRKVMSPWPRYFPWQS